MNYSIHTYELMGEFKFKNWGCLFKKIKKHLPSIEVNMPDNKSGYFKEEYIFRKGDLPGITSIRLVKTETTTSVYRCFIYIRINPRNSITGSKHSDGEIINATDIEYSLGILQNHLAFLPTKVRKSLTINRVDYCVNLEFNRQEEAQEYLNLITKGLPRKCLKEDHYFDHNSNHIFERSTYTLKCGSYEFEIYLKSKQMDNHRCLENASSYLGYLRLELRAFKPKLEQLSINYNKIYYEGNYHEFLCFSPVIAEKEIKKIIGEMVGYGDFLTYANIESILDDANMYSSVKEFSKNIPFMFLNGLDGIDIADVYQLTRKKWVRMLNRFNRLRISPIPIPDNYSLEFYPGIDSWDTYFDVKKDVKTNVLTSFPI